ncbi:hypothetical protein HOH45_00440 [bacterium]|jgi:hypothetical protein|nr:hypothetical protein [bacterium]
MTSKQTKNVSILTLILLMSISLTSSLFSENMAISVAAKAYTLTVENSGATLTDTKIKGAYGYIGYGQHSLSLEYDMITDSDDTALQNNSLGIYTYYGHPGNRYKIGYQNISTEATNNDGNIIIVGLEHDSYDYYLTTRLWTAGLSMYGSSYNLTEGDITVLQFSPHFTTYFYPILVPGYADFTTRYNSIFLSDSTGFDKSSFHNIEATINYYFGSFVFNSRIWTGESVLGVFDSGHVIYNSKDILKTGIASSLTYYFTKQLSSTVGYQYQILRGESETADTNFGKLTIMAGYSF